MINSSYQSLHEEIEKLKKIFMKNNYPVKFIDKCVFQFFNKIFQKKLPVEPPDSKKEVMLVLPFLGSISWFVKKELLQTFRKNLPTCKLKVIFKTSNRLSTFFSFKDKLPRALDAGVIYRYNCSNCNVSYIGCSKRYWEKRLEEHTHISALTGGPLRGLQIFAPLQHVRDKKCSSSTPLISRDDFKIVGRESNNYLLLIKESLSIYKHKPELNGNAQSVPLYLFNSAPHELRHTHKHTNVCMNSSFFLVSLMYSFLR